MRVALLNAHTAYARGATCDLNGLIYSEYQISVKVNKELSKLLYNNKIDNFIVDGSHIQPYNASLHYKAVFVDDQKANIAIETHLNSSDNKKACGLEVLYCKGRNDSKQLALCVVEGLKKYLPFQVRRENGLSEVDNIHILEAIICPSVITECFFLSNSVDQIYLLFPNAIKILANALLEGILEWQKII